MPSTRGGPLRVLFVEDEPAGAKVLAKGLREQSYAVDIAGDGEDAESKTSALPEAVVKEVIFLSAEQVKKERPRGVSFASRLSSAVAAFIVDSSSID